MPVPIIDPKWSSSWFGPGAIGRYFPGPQSPLPQQTLSDAEWAEIFLNPQMYQQPAPYQTTPGGYAFETPGIQPPDPMNPLADWDYLNPPVNENGVPLNALGEELPETAVSWTPQGEPFFGDGFEGWWKGVQHRINMSPQVAEDEKPWFHIPGSAYGDDVPLAQQFLGFYGINTDAGDPDFEASNSLLESAGIGFDLLKRTAGALFSPVNRAWREFAIDDKGEYNAVGQAGLYVGEAVRQGLNFFGSFSEGTERGLGTIALTLKDLAGDRQADFGDWRIRSANFNWIWELSPAVMGWNALQAFRNKPSYDEVADSVKQNWEAARIAYTMFEDEALKGEYVRRMQEGEHPQLLAMEMENPWTEIWGLVVADPLNYVGFFTKGKVFETRLGSVADEFAKPVDKLDDLTRVERLANTPANEIGAHFDEIVQEQYRVARATRVANDGLARKQGLFTLNPQGKRSVVGHRMGRITGYIYANAGQDADQAMEFLRGLALMHSDDINDVREGVAIANRFKAPRVMFSEAAQTTGSILRDVLWDAAEGGLNPKKFLSAFRKAQEGGVDEVIEFIDGLYKKTLDNYFPSLSEQAAAFERLEDIRTGGKLKPGESLEALEMQARLGAPNALSLGASRINKIVQSRFYAPINSFYAALYMGMSPGYAFRNLISNTVHVLVDVGPGAYGKGTLFNSAKWVDRTSTWLGGDIPHAIRRGIGGAVAGAEQIAREKVPKLFRFASDWAQNMEVKAAERVVGKSVEDAMLRMLTRGRALPDVDGLRAVFSDDAITYLERLVVDNFGDVDTALLQFAEDAREGTVVIDLLKSMEFVGQDGKALRSFQVYDDIRDIVRSGKPVDEMIEDVRKVFDDFTTEAQAAALEKTAIPETHEQFDHLGTEAGSAVEEKLLSADIADAVGQEVIATTTAHSQWRGIYKDVYKRFNAIARERRKSNQPLLDERLLQEIEETVFGGQRLAWWSEAGNFAQTTAESRAYTAKVWADTKGIRAMRTPTKDDLTKIWEKIRLSDGDELGELTKQRLLDYLWDVNWRTTQTSRFRLAILQEQSAAQEFLSRVFTAFPELKSDEIATKIDRAYKATQYAVDLSDTVYTKGVGWQRALAVMQQQLADGDVAGAIRTLASRYGIGTITETGTPYDHHILNVVNRYGPGTVPDGFTSDASKFGVDLDLDGFGELSQGERGLYHATTNIDAVETQGLLSRAETGASGLGGTIEEAPNMVSVTYDYGKAAIIQERLQLAARAARGELKADDILNHFAPEFGEDAGKISELLMLSDDLEYDDWDKLDDLIRAEYGDTPEGVYNLVRDLDQSLGDLAMSQDWLDSPWAGISNDFETVRNIDPDKIGIVEVAAREGATPNHLPVEYELRFASDDLVVLMGEGAVGRAAGRQAYGSLDNLTPGDFAIFNEAFHRRAVGGKMNPLEAGLLRFRGQSIDPRPLPAALAEGATPSMPQAIVQQLDEINALRDRTIKGIRTAYGQTRTAMADTASDALKNWAKTARTRVAEARLVASEYGAAMRDFTLLNYRDRLGIDTILAYIYPYQYWYSRTYSHWMRRIASNPGLIANYKKYRDQLEKIHAGTPDWWKYNINTNELLGLDSEHPLFFNLEATLNPLNGLTGTDFNDPYKRVDMWSKLLDDLGKFGPSTWTPFSVALAYSLYMDGEQDAAARWAGRLIPQTQVLRYGAAAFTNLRDVEVDPFINIFGGGYDPYEVRRIGRALGTLVEQGLISQEQAIDATTTRSGPAWEQAVELALDQRAPGTLASYFLGVGFKGRSVTDMSIDQFYQEYRMLWSLEPTLSPQEFRVRMDGLRTKYPFMDTVLLSAKWGLEQDRALAYNVLSRVPPGMSSDISRLADIPDGLMSQFYNDKGHIENWTPSDRERFMAGIIDLGTILALPTDATREEWTAARNAYTSMQDQGRAIFGDDIWDKVDMFYAASAVEDTEMVRNLRDSLIAAHPEIEQALDWRSQQIMGNRTLYDYYGGIKFYEDYWKGRMYDDIERAMGEDIWDKWDEYYRLKEIDEQNLQALRDAGQSTSGYERLASAFFEDNNLERYFEIRDSRQAALQARLASMGDYLIAQGEGTLTLRPDLPDQLSVTQQGALDQLNPQVVPWAEYEQVLGPNASELLLDYFIDGEELPAIVVEELSSLAQAMQTDIGTLIAMMYQSYSQELQVAIP